jgi:hypothetical protein
MRINNPAPRQVGKRSIASQLRALATLQRNTQQRPVLRYSLGLSTAGNPSLDVALGCGVSNLVNSIAH